MPAKRTVDTSTNDTGTAFVGLRLSHSQVLKLDELRKTQNLNRSAMMRQLIIDAHEKLSAGDPF